MGSSSSRKLKYSKLNHISTDPITQNYFKAVNTIQSKNYNFYMNNLTNLSLCLDKRNFETDDNVRTVFYTGLQVLYFDWIDYLNDSLYSVSFDLFHWPQKMLDSLTNAQFLYENAFQSILFFEEFGMMTIPASLREETISNKNKKINSTLSITDNYGGSFVDYIKEPVLPDDPAIEYQVLRSKIKEYIKLLKIHIFNEKHPINIVVSYFTKYFRQDIFALLKMKKTINNKDFEDYVNAFIVGLKNFILTIKTCIKLFYVRSINIENFKEEKDELINMVACLIFNNNEIYSAIFLLYSERYDNEIKKFEQKLNEFRSVTLQDLGIKKQFCLDKKTFDYFGCKNISIPDISDKRNDMSENNCQIFKENKKSQRNILFSNQENTDIGFNDFKNPLDDFNSIKSIPILKNESVNIINEVDSRKYLEENKAWNEPYMNVLLKLCSIENHKAPFEKMMIIAYLSDEITKSINNFWKDKNYKEKGIDLNIEADELVSIFIYIIIKVQMPTLLIHTAMINDFATNISKSTMIGYYFSIINAGISYITELKDIDELKEKGKKKAQKDNKEKK